MVALREALCTLIATSRSVLLRMRNVLDTFSTENQNTQFTFNNSPPPENRVV